MVEFWGTFIKEKLFCCSLDARVIPPPRLPLFLLLLSSVLSPSTKTVANNINYAKYASLSSEWLLRLSCSVSSYLITWHCLLSLNVCSTLWPLCDICYLQCPPPPHRPSWFFFFLTLFLPSCPHSRPHILLLLISFCLHVLPTLTAATQCSLCVDMFSWLRQRRHKGAQGPECVYSVCMGVIIFVSALFFFSTWRKLAAERRGVLEVLVCVCSRRNMEVTLTFTFLHPCSYACLCVCV